MVFNISEALKFAQDLAKILRCGDVLLFQGDLGTGKSTLIREMIQTLMNDNVDVPSPTFTLVQTYDSPRGQLWHFDLYRLEHPDEVLELNIDDAFYQGISFVEWPDRLGYLKPEDTLLIELAHGKQPDERTITLTPSKTWSSRLEGLA